MTSPAAAFERVTTTGPFDDPLHAWYPLRWHLDEQGVLCRTLWRGPTVRYPEHSQRGRP